MTETYTLVDHLFVCERGREAYDRERARIAELEAARKLSYDRAMAMPVIRDYKGFRSRLSPDQDKWPGLQNAYYVREDGTEVCLGQTDDLVSSAEWHLRRPLPTWMTGKPEAYSEHHDPEKTRTTCAHGVSLDAVCDPCAESYGSARAM